MKLSIMGGLSAFIILLGAFGFYTAHVVKSNPTPDDLLVAVDEFVSQLQYRALYAEPLRETREVINGVHYITQWFTADVISTRTQYTIDSMSGGYIFAKPVIEEGDVVNIEGTVEFTRARRASGGAVSNLTQRDGLKTGAQLDELELQSIRGGTVVLIGTPEADAAIRSLEIEGDGLPLLDR